MIFLVFTIFVKTVGNRFHLVSIFQSLAQHALMALFMVWPLRKASQDDPSRALRACFAFYPFQLPTNLTIDKLMFFYKPMSCVVLLTYAVENSNLMLEKVCGVAPFSQIHCTQRP
jgi:hypothetical protein